MVVLLRLLRESLDWVREAGRRGGGALFRFEREWVEELALGLRAACSKGWVDMGGSGRRCERWFVNRLRRTEEVEVVLGG